MRALRPRRDQIRSEPAALGDLRHGPLRKNDPLEQTHLPLPGRGRSPIVLEDQEITVTASEHHETTFESFQNVESLDTC